MFGTLAAAAALTLTQVQPGTLTLTKNRSIAPSDCPSCTQEKRARDHPVPAIASNSVDRFMI